MTDAVESPGPHHAGAEGLPDEAYARMSLILRAGLVLALALLAVAIGVYLAEHPGAQWTSSGPNPSAQYLSLPGIAGGLIHGEPAAYLTLGVLCLVATPILRVLSGFYYFEKGGERAMMRVTILVFALLLVGLFVVGPLVR